MGSHKIKTVDMSLDPEGAKKTKKAPDQVKEAAEKVAAEAESEAKTKQAPKKPQKIRSKNYVSSRSQVDRTKFYSLADAVSMVQKLHYAKFVSSITADIVLKDASAQVEVTFPHSTGQTKRVSIATDDLLKKVEKGTIDFDILIAEPNMMAKIAKLARVLGPKGLMPNPKSGTVTTDPDKKKKELEGGKTLVKAEKKAPLMHQVIGKTDQKPTELVSNVEALLKAIGPKKVLKLVLSSTMSPGVKVDLTEFQIA